MIQSFAPRFLREEDSIVLTAKVINLTEEELTTNVKLKLENLISSEEIPVQSAVSKVRIGGGKTEQVSWKIKIGNDLSGIRYTLLTQSENHSDAEQGVIPILPNKSIVIKTLAFYTEAQSGNNKINFEAKDIISNKKNRMMSYTIEYTPNPAWYVVASLPYLMEYPYECAEQTFHRIYAVKLAEKIFSQNPAIESMIRDWEKIAPDVLTSNLGKNKELKNIALEETNWVQKAQNETSNKKRISLMADVNHRKQIYNKGLKSLLELQKPSGGWPWFKGMDENLYITQVILAGEGRLRKLDMGILPDAVVNKALQYCDNEYLAMYNRFFEYKTDTSKHIPYPSTIHYFYTQSFFAHTPTEKTREAITFFYQKSKKHWLQFNEYSQAMLSIATFRKGETRFAQNIMTSLKERAVIQPELGMYWRSFNSPSYYWYQSNIESAAMLILAFEEVSNDKLSVLLLQKYLLNNKRTNSWDNTKSTADACYAFISGNKNIAVLKQPKVKIGGEVLNMALAQPGTGYIKKRYERTEVKKELFEIEIENNSDIQGWGGIYLQYETPSVESVANASGLSLRREFFIVRNDVKGETLISLKNDKIKPGDLLECRLTFTTDREMEYVHLRDPRAGNTEPEYAPSGYKYANGVSYYFSIKDAATNFFISKLYKGQYTLKYRMFVTHEGNFSMAPATLQSMYAPEFSANSEGRRLLVY